MSLSVAAGASPRRSHLRRARHWIANRGWSGFLQEIFWRTRLFLKGEAIPGRPGPDQGPHPFDTAYNVDTTGLVWGESLDGVEASGSALYWATGYYGVSPSAFDDALRAMSLSWHEFTFIDIGCGKGRALLLALRYGWHAVLGIELSPELAEIARRNLRSFSAPWRHRDIDARVATGDATVVDLPPGPLVLYLYHPFAAPVMTRFLEHVRRALAAGRRPIYLLYTNPELGSMLDQTPWLEKLWDRHFAMSNEDVAADRFGSHYERIVVYKARP